MKEILYMLQDLFMLKPDNGIGLSQFRTVEVEISEQPKPSINNKNVKLSDLMRRA